ncbi:MAG: HAD family phosphatase [Candidatus Moraniibacteriota bacterium]|nr:MAG: HAD family phosphatase [Candidatus Moranbacteria bacterium]
MLLDVSKINSIIFDMDGVLLHSSDCHEEAWRDALSLVGITQFSYAGIAGMRTDEAVQKILNEQGISITETEKEHLISQKRKKALELLMLRGRIADESKGLIFQLSKRYRLALASSASVSTVLFFLQKSGYGEIFSEVLDGTSVRHAKPDPEIYDLALERLNIAPQQAIIVEDAVNGIEAAHRAGIRVIAVAGTEKREMLLEAGAEVVVDKLSQIGSILL